jgi:hypothetical protein
MRDNEDISMPDKVPSRDSGGIRPRKGRAWIGVVGFLLSLLSAVPLLLPGELIFPGHFHGLLLWTLLVTPPLALVTNTVALTRSRPMVLGAIGLVISVTTCVLWAKGLICLYWLWQNGPICP